MIYWAFTPAKLKLSLSEYKLKLFNLTGFLTHVQQFSRLLNKFEVGFLVKQFATFFIGSSVCFFKMKFNPFPDVLNTKMCRFQTFSANMAACLSSRTTTYENTSNAGRVLLIYIKTLYLLSSELLVNSKTR